MQKVCANSWCKTSFEVTDEDLAFYEKVSPVFNGKKELIPPPTQCPGCRQQRRILQRNFYHFFSRSCSKTGGKIISMYRENVPFPVYDVSIWWGDSWSPMDYGKDIDWSCHFLEQITSLFQRVPKMSNVVSSCENCDYSNFAAESRNCYLVAGCVGNENCAYGHIVWLSKYCFDCLYTYRSELCYECVNCNDCYNVHFASDCINCSECSFMEDCTSCTSCFGCVGLKNKKYHLFNVAQTEKDYRESVAKNQYDRVKICEKMKTLRSSLIVKNAHTVGCENVTGDYLLNCKNVRSSFDMKNSEDCVYCSTLEAKDSQDCDYTGKAVDLAYNIVTCYGYHLICSLHCMAVSSELIYCENCFSCKDCFGCVGLKNAKYCILNKQYAKDEYERLVSKIIEKMRADGEWGEFFPVSMSPFGYNETVAQEYFPLTKEQALERGFNWSDYEAPMPKVEKIIRSSDLPQSIDQVPDDILNWAIECEETKKPFKIIKQELEFYRQMKLPIPRLHPDERHKRRMAKRNPRKLWNRTCDKCQKPIATSYSPDRPEIVYCEECYLKEVY